MVFFNDPVPCDEPAERAVRMALDMRQRVRELETGWSKDGHGLGFCIGLAQGYATLGRVGYAGRFDYAAIGTVTNLAARLCGEAGPWQVLTHERVVAALGTTIDAGLVDTLALKGLNRPVRAFEINSLVTSEGRREHSTPGEAGSDTTERLFRPVAAATARRLAIDARRRRERVRRRGAVGQHRTAG